MKTRWTFLCGIGLLTVMGLAAGGQSADRSAVDEAEIAALIRDLRSDDEGEAAADLAPFTSPHSR
jgi:hypothetical protein